MPFAIGENVGPYRVIQQLGQGGMATVYKAYHASLDRYVALKVMHAAFSEDPSFLARFQREARVVAKLDHPNIVPIFDFADHDGSPYLVMKFIEGETLKARLGRGPLARDEGLRIVDAVGQALSYAHGRGILHRDIKPSNVLLSPTAPSTWQISGWPGSPTPANRRCPGICSWGRLSTSPPSRLAANVTLTPAPTSTRSASSCMS